MQGATDAIDERALARAVRPDQPKALPRLVGPLIGSILLGSLQQLATVTISSAANLLIVGLLLVGFVIIAPNGLIGLVQERLRARRQS